MGLTQTKGSFLDERTVDVWDKKTVTDWLTNNGFSKYTKFFKQREIDGAKLCELNKAELVSLGVESEDVDKLLLQIEELMSYSSSHQSKFVEKIVKKFEKLSNHESIPTSTKIGFARYLSVRDHLIQTYMANNLERTEKLYKKVWGEDPTNLTDNDRFWFTLSYSGAYGKLESPFQAENFKNELVLRREDILKVHYVWIEEPRNLSLKQCLNPLMDAESTETNRIQCGILVGPYLLTWVAPGLVVPKKVYNRMTLYVKGGIFFKGPLAKRALDIIASQVCKWNSKYHFKYRTDNGFGRNSMSFVDSVCKALGINFGDHTILTSLRKNSMRQLSIEFHPDLARKLALPETVKNFLCHQQIDEYASALLEACPTLPKDYPFEWNLLRMIDVIFWNRYAAQSVRGDTSFHYENSAYRSCPFEKYRINLTKDYFVFPRHRHPHSHHNRSYSQQQ